MGALPSNDFAQLVRRHRLNATLSQEALAELAGLSVRGISDLERGLRAAPRLETVRMLADALGLSPDDRAALILAARSTDTPSAEQSVREGIATAAAEDGDRMASLDLIPPPVPPTRLVGRLEEIARTADVLGREDARLITLTGPGGVGKTRLAVAVAAAAGPRFVDGIHFVALASVSDSDLVAAAIARTLDLRETGDQALVDLLVGFLRDKRMLLVLDNFEQVVEAGPLVAHLLARCPNLAVLVTSRLRLRISGEYEHVIAPLSVPTQEECSDLARVAEASAVRLFVERGRAARADFALTQENAPAVAEICRRLDGLPLAIELAAAWVKFLPPPMLLTRLERRLPLLTGGGRDVPARQQTMRDAINWSVDLLTPGEQALFRRLAVFVGGFTLEAAEVVAGTPDGSCLDVLYGVASLVDKSLLQRVDGPNGQPRFAMLETVREFAADALVQSEDRGPDERHAAYYLGLATWAERAYWNEESGDWQGAVEPEQGNLWAALDWATEHGDTETALRLASVLFDPLWALGEHAREQGTRVRRALAMLGGSPEARVKALTTAAWLALIRDDLTEGCRLGEEAMRLARAHDDTLGGAMASYVLGLTHFQGNQIEEARSHLEAAVDGFWASGALGRLGWALCYLASLDSRAAVDEGGNPAAIQEAISHCEEALCLFQRIGQRRGIVRATHGIAYLAYKIRDLPRALTTTQELLGSDWNEHLPVYHYLEDIADIAGRIDHADLAARLYGAADAQREKLGRPLEAAFREEYERDQAITRGALGEAAFAAAWAKGRAMPLAEAVQLALGSETQPAGPQPPIAALAQAVSQLPLTQRERDLPPGSSAT